MLKNGYLIILSFFLLFQITSAQKKKEIKDNKIKIGLLIPSKTSVEAKFGAEMAIAEANKKGGINGQLFELVVRSMEGPWGTGSKNAVNLIFKENVWAILGSHDGRNAHLVEQVCTKTRRIYMSLWATDPTLSQAFVPWYFSCVPNDIQQSKLLVKEIYNHKKLKNIAIISDKSYDSKLTLKSFLKEIKKIDGIKPITFFYENKTKNFDILVASLSKNNVQAVVLLGNSDSSLAFIQQLKNNKINKPIYATSTLFGEQIFKKAKLADYNNVVAVTAGNWLNLNKESFNNNFKNKNGFKPSAVAAFTFDGVNCIIEAIKKSGLNRDKVENSLSKIRHEGVTGIIQFDKKGNRLHANELIEIRNATSIPIQK